MQHALRIQDLRVMVNLGCTLEEQATAQEVLVSLEFRFHAAPAGLTTDRLEDTLCYAELSQLIKQVSEAKPYHLIEKLAGDLFVELGERTRAHATLGLKVHKVRPPVKDLIGGTQYVCGDFLI